MPHPRSVPDVYFLTLHAPYRSAEDPVAINATIVHARTLLHPRLPQPDGGRMYRCLTEFPGRTPGCLVPLSTLTSELDGGDLWPEIGDWEAVVDALVGLSRDRACDAIRMGLTAHAAGLLSMGPSARLHVYDLNGDRTCLGPAERQGELRDLETAIDEFVRQGPFWPGDALLPPPDTPPTMPYRPYTSP